MLDCKADRSHQIPQICLILSLLVCLTFIIISPEYEETNEMNSISDIRCYLESMIMMTHIWKPSNDEIRPKHDDVIKWKHFPRYWPFVRGIHRSPVNSPHKDQWRGALMFTLICVWINGYVNNREAGDLRRHRAHYNVIVMKKGDWDVIFPGNMSSYVHVAIWFSKTCHLLWCWNILVLPASLSLTNIAGFNSLAP